MSLYNHARFLYSQVIVKIPEPTSSFKGQTIIVTGASDGLGKHAVQEIVRLGAARVILAVRNVKKGEGVRDEIVKKFGSAGAKDQAVLEVWQVDVSDFDSIRKFAARVRTMERLDAVLLNAAVMRLDFVLAEGYESMLATNVLGNTLLGSLVLPVLRESATKTGLPGRLSFVGSDIIYLNPLPSLPPTSEPLLSRLSKDVTEKQMVDRYPMSKLFMLFTVRELAERNPVTKESNVIIVVTTPGLCPIKNYPDEASRSTKIAIAIMQKTIARSTEAGSWTLVDSVRPDLPVDSHGRFLMNTKTFDEGPLVKSAAAKDLAKRWNQEVFSVVESSK